jgi:hypothetical protein
MNRWFEFVGGMASGALIMVMFFTLWFGVRYGIIISAVDEADVNGTSTLITMPRVTIHVEPYRTNAVTKLIRS